MGTLENLAQSRFDPVSMLQSVDPLAPELPMKQKLWTAAMFAGPAGAQGLAMKAIPALAERGLPSTIARILAGTAGGAAAGAPFGKTTEGAATGLAGGLLGEPVNYLARGVKYGASEALGGGGGAPGVMKRFVNTLGEITGLGGDLSKTGRDILPKIGEWKGNYYDKVYDPLKRQARDDFPPDGAPSPFLKQMYNAGHGGGVLPKRIAGELKATEEATEEMRKLAETGAIDKKQYEMGMKMAQTPEEQAAINKKYQDSLIDVEAKKQVLADLPRYKDRLKDPMVTFDEYEETIRNLRNYGWEGVMGEPRKGPLSADERAAVHGLKQEMLGHFPDQGLADAYTTARDHAHAWEVTNRLIKGSEYAEGVRPKISEVQKQYQRHVEDLKDALGPDYAELLNQVLFNGRLTPDRISREWGESSGSVKGNVGGAPHWFGHFKLPLLQGPPRTPTSMLGWTGPPSVLAGQLVKPREEESLPDAYLRVKNLVVGE